jgi:single-strand DNA-binding protein
MNKVILIGRLTRDPVIRYSQGDNSQAVARYTLAVDRRFSRRQDNGGDQQQTADFIGCVAFGRSAEFAEKYLHQGTKICVEGRIQTGRYTNRDGQTVYTTDVVVENQEFVESKAASQANAGSMPDYGGYQNSRPAAAPASAPAGGSDPSADGKGGESPDGFMNLPEGIEEELPFQ